MCIQQRWITNKYTGHKFLVKCGHCEACLQEKANKRTNRLKAELQDGRIALFVTLTYNRFCCPYVKVDDLMNKVDILPVYREITARYDYRKDGWRYYNQSVILDNVYNPDYYGIFKFDKNDNAFLDVKTLAHRKHNVGVCYYPDLQNFHKRLSINLKRKYNYYETYRAFNVSEYGESSHRPHFHVLLFIKASDEKLFRNAIYEAWPFASKHITMRGIEVARNASSYVSSYVNCGSNFPLFLQNNFKPKHSFSKGLGMGLASFQLDEILQKVGTGDLRYTRLSRQPDGLVYLNIPIPKYVINRYFPLFKGYSRIVGSSLHDVLLYPYALFRFPKIEYTFEDIHKIHVRLHNAYNQYFKGRTNFEDYLLLYERVWSAYRSTVYRHFMEDVSVPLLEKYDNLYETKLQEKYCVHPSFEIPDGVCVNPNEFVSNKSHHYNLTRLYHQKLKTKTVNNLVMSNLNYYF